MPYNASTNTKAQKPKYCPYLIFEWYEVASARALCIMQYREYSTASIVT